MDRHAQRYSTPEQSLAKVHLVINGDSAALLEDAAEAFLQASPTTTDSAWPPYLLALRQGGLRDDVFDQAAARGVPGWFDPPVCVFHELPAWLGATGLRPLGDFERAALLASIVRADRGPALRGREGDFVGAIEQFFGELRAEGMTPEAYAAAVGSLGEREQFEKDRDAQLVRLYAAYVGALDLLGRRDGRDTLVDSAAAVRASPSDLEVRLGGRREIRIVGLADLRGGWRPLLSALNASPALDRIVLYLLGDLPVAPELVASIERVTGTGIGAALFRPVPEHIGRFELVAESDVERELEAVGSRVRALVETGTPPHRIAVIARDARPYGEFAIRAMAAAGVPVTARRRITYREIPVIRAVLALLGAAADGWTRHGLAELGSQPYFAGDVDARVVNFIGYRERVAGLAGWTEALDRLLAEARAAETTPDDGERRAVTLPAQWVESAAERFRSFAVMASAFESERPVAGWVEWLVDWLERDPWRVEERIARVPDDRWDILRLDLLGWRGLRTVAADWLAAERQWPGADEKPSTGEFVIRLRAILACDVALWTETSRGVQVIEGLAASHRAFDHVFLVGMNAGRFPGRAPSSLLLGERDRDALRAAGLPLDTASEWEARERALFRGLVAGATRTLTLSYVTLDDAGADAIPSSFVDALRDAGRAETAEWAPVPLHRLPAIAEHAFRAAAIERERGTGRPSPWNGLIQDAELRAWLGDAFGDSRLWSPTQIESYAKCPWAYFSDRMLRLQLREDPDGDIDPRARGSVLHDALRRFYEAAGHRIGGPVFLQAADAVWGRTLLRDSLTEALAAAEANVWLGHPALRELKHAELEQLLIAFLDFEIEENRKAFDGRTTAGKTVRTAVAEHEIAFDAVTLERDGVTFRFRGIIDRLEIGVDDRAPGPWVAAVDYKTTIYSCPGAGQAGAWDDGVVLQVPLYAWALSVLRPGSAVARVEYRALKQAKRVHSLSLTRVGKGGVTDGADERARMDRALDAVARHVRRVRAGEFPAAPAPSCHCPPFCHAWDVCRVRGGPSTGRD